MSRKRSFFCALSFGLTVALSGVVAPVGVNAEAKECGVASWYALDGRRTASGEVMNSGRMTAAHRRLPFGSVVTVRNMRNGRTVKVRINDRGPFVRSRVIDLSRAAARRLGFVGRGMTRVCLSH